MTSLERTTRLRDLEEYPAAKGAEGSGVSEDVIDGLVRDLNDLHRGAALDTALRIGRLIVDRFYRGDLTAWRKHTMKEASFRKLAARTQSDLRMSPTGLYRAVALYELVERLDLRDLRNVGVTHLRLVLGLPDAQQRRLLSAAEESGWESERLEEEAARIRGGLAERRGRPAMPPPFKLMRRIAQLCRRARNTGGEEPEVSRLSAEELRGLYEAVDFARSDLEQFQRMIKTAMSSPGKPARRPDGNS